MKTCSRASATAGHRTRRSPPRYRTWSTSCAVTSKRRAADMPVAKVHRISAAAPNDVSGIESLIAAGRIDPSGIVAILGKTEGNGNVNDFTRGYATLALTLMLEKHLGTRAEEVCLVMSGGTEGAMAPHWTVFERAQKSTHDGDGKGPALAI